MFIGQNQFCSSDLLAKIADVIDSAVLITRLGNSGQYDQRIIYINPSFTALTGYESAELLGRSIDAICDPRTGASKMIEFYNSCRANQNFSLVLDSFKKQGAELKLKLDVRQMVDNVQGAYYYIIMCKDAAAQQQVQQPQPYGHQINQYKFAAGNFQNFNNAEQGAQYQSPQQYQQPQPQQYQPQFSQSAAQPAARTQFQNLAPQQNIQPQSQYVQPLQQTQAEQTGLQALVNRTQSFQQQLDAAQQKTAPQNLSAAAHFAAMQNPQPQPTVPNDGMDIPVAPIIKSKTAEIKTDDKVADYCKTQFLSNMSHDLRTPLNAIIGFSEVIKDQLFGPIENNRYVSYAQDIHKSGQELLGTISEIMELSEVEPEAEKIEEEKIDLTDTIESVLDVLSSKAFEGDVKIIKSLDAQDVKFKGDRRKLKQVMAGVIGSAIKLSKKGSKIELTTSLTDKGDFRLVAYAPTAHIGTGKSSLGSLLGTASKKVESENPEMALARKFVEAHQGKFSMFHSATSGTEINITLPAARIAIEPEKKSWLKVIS